MARRGGGRATTEARFERGEVGVDGAAVDEAVDPAAAEQAKAREALLKGHTWLGREALVWLLWKSESTEPVCALDGQDVTVLFGDRLVLRAGAGEVTELSVKGVSAPYSKLVKRALAEGLLVHSARLRVTHGERAFEATLDAERFDLKSGKLPALLAEEESERLSERLELANQLGRLVDVLLETFMRERCGKAWRSAVKGLEAWMRSAA